MDWSDLDASSKANFKKRCNNRWAEVRSGFEPRELEDGREQCEEAKSDLNRIQGDGTECDHLRALYVD